MNAIDTIGAISLFVTDVDRSKTWYQRVFELPVTYEDSQSAVIQFGNTIVNLLVRDAAHGLIAPAHVARPEGGSSFQLTIWVDDADATSATLQTRGVDLVNGPIDRPWGQRTACFADPDGHLWEIAQTIPRDE